MEFDQFGLEEDEDAATQFMIEQSLLEIGKLRGTCRETSDDRLVPGGTCFIPHISSKTEKT